MGERKTNPATEHQYSLAIRITHLSSLVRAWDLLERTFGVELPVLVSEARDRARNEAIALGFNFEENGGFIAHDDELRF